MIKPDAVANGHIGNILAMITNAGFKIVSLKLTNLQLLTLKHFMLFTLQPLRRIRNSCQGPIVAAILENNAVEDFRTLIDATNPAEAAEGTIRKAYATSIEKCSSRFDR
jgi:nucleoside-diphosphate kinase